MVNDEIIHYINQQLQQGVERQNITNQLLAQGWSQQDIDEAFGASWKPTSTGVTGAGAGDAVSITWTKSIPRFNKVILVLSLLLVFGLDLSIIISDKSLIGFWYIMLGVFAVFILFFCLENYVFRKKFAASKSKIDLWISVVIILRNLLFLLNFIPGIQLFGLLALPTVGGGLLLAYVILIALRYAKTDQSMSVASPVS